MILIQMPLKRDYVIELFNDKTIEGFTFHYIKQERMKLYFEVSGNQKEASELVKKTIQKSELGNALFYHVTYSEDG